MLLRFQWYNEKLLHALLFFFGSGLSSISPQMIMIIKMQNIKDWITSILFTFCWNFELLSFTKNCKLNVLISARNIFGIKSSRSHREWLYEMMKCYMFLIYQNLTLYIIYRVIIVKRTRTKLYQQMKKKKKKNQTSNYPLKKQMETIFLIDKKNELSRLM